MPREIADAQDSLERRIRAHMARGRVQVTLTDNRYTMISVRRIARERRYEVRLHHMFADADPVITRALAHYIAENDAECVARPRRLHRRQLPVTSAAALAARRRS